MNLRQLHAYLGGLIAPSVLFFSLTGAIQLLALHESHGGYDPPALVEKLARVHRDQVFAIERHQAAPAPSVAPAAPPAAPAPHKGPRPSVILLKLYFLLVAATLAASTGIGLWMAWSHPRRKRGVAIAFLLGAAIPILLLRL